MGSRVVEHRPDGDIILWRRPNKPRGMTGEQLSAALPKEMTTGLDLKELGDILQRRRDDLYPETVMIDLDAAKRVQEALVAGGLVKPGANIAGLHDTTIAGG